MSEKVTWHYGRKQNGVVNTTTEAELEPSFFTFVVVSTYVTSPSTRVLGLVAKVLMTKLKNEGLKTCVQNPRAITCNMCTWASGSITYNESEERRFEPQSCHLHMHRSPP
jgi:hypothetical protein